ncbi:MAG: UDP-glucose 4-epimerase [Candidatus Saccharibacteria bacterium]|nr:UDP-glucose 4-epimerase [Candidatus Saccharibacteria bacterium]
MKTILVTGGAGFIGSHTVVELVRAGYRPIIVDDFSNSEHSVIVNLQKLLGQTITCYEQDYTYQSKLRKIIEDEKVDGIIHFAAFKQVGESVKEPLKYYTNNVSGLIGLLEMAAAYKIKHFVFSSSCTVYGEPKKLPVTEDSPLQPAESPYGATKQMGESILRDVTTASEISNAMSLRYFNPIGAHPSALIGELPRGVPANLVPFITQTAAGLREKLTVYGDDYPTDDGSCIRDYIHVVDLAKAHVSALALLENKQASYYDVVNIGTGKGSSVLELLKTFESVTGVKLNYEIGPRRKGDITSTYASVGKAAGLLGWQAEKTLEDSLVDAWRWQQTLSNEEPEES